MYKKVSTDMNFVEREKQVEKFWEDNQIFEKSMKVREGNPSYVFYDGPPTANGKPHIGHVETRVIKDMIPRYRTMKGYQVPRKAGWDTHGLPVELEVEKKLGLDGKDQIEKYGVEPFIEQCKESVWKYEGMWEDFSHTVGFWADMKNPYVTYHNDYIESEWWALKEIWKKGLLYEGHKIVPYCPRCGTPLSSHEVAQGYEANTRAVFRSLPVTTLFIDGNHENFEQLNSYAVEQWNGGKVHIIEDNMIHLMRAQIFTIDGLKFFTFGGAYSIDKMSRAEGISWFPEEIPSREEYEEGWANLEKEDFQVDYILTHTAPRDVAAAMGYGELSDDEVELRQYLQRVADETEFQKWYFGHFHEDAEVEEVFVCLYDEVVEVS